MYIIVDGSSIGYRAFYAAPNRGFEDVPDEEDEIQRVAAAFMYTFLTHLVAIVKEVDATRPAFSKVFICWDGRYSVTGRRKLYPPYKTSREPKKGKRTIIMPHTFLNIAKDSLSRASQRYGLHDRYAEADDLIAFMCDMLGDQRKCIITSDKDMLQLVNKNTICYEPLRKVWTNEKGVMELMGIRPDQVVEYKAVVGDPSDNYHGIKGIGEKKGVELINSHTNYDVMYPEVDIFRKLAKIPFEGWDDSVFMSELGKMDFDKIVNWDTIVKEWNLNDRLAFSLNGVV